MTEPNPRRLSPLLLCLLALAVLACTGAPPAASLGPGEAMERLRSAVPPDVLQHCEDATYSETFPAEPGELAGLDCDLPRDAAVDYATYRLFDSATSMNALYDTLAAGVTSGGNAQGAGCDASQPGPATWEHGRALCFVFITDDSQVRWTHEGLNVLASAFRDDGDFGPLIDWWRQAGPHQ